MVGLGVHLAGLLPLGRRARMVLDPPLRVRGVLLVVVVRFLANQSLQRPLVPLLQVRRIISMRHCRLSLPLASTDVNPPPMTTGTSTPAYSIFNEKDPSNPSAILQYQSITATPAYRGTSLEVSQCNLSFVSFCPAAGECRKLGTTLAGLSTKPQDGRRVWPIIIWSACCTDNQCFRGTTYNPAACDWFDIWGWYHWRIWNHHDPTCHGRIWSLWATTTYHRHRYWHRHLWRFYVWPTSTATLCIWGLGSVSTATTTTASHKHWY